MSKENNDAAEDTDPFAGFIGETSRDGETVDDSTTNDAIPSWDDEETEENTNDTGTDESPADADDGDSGDAGDDAADTDGAGESDIPGDDSGEPTGGQPSDVDEAQTAREELAAARAELALYRTGQVKPQEKADEPAAAAPEPDLSDLTKPDPSKYDYGEIDSGYLEAVAEYNAEVVVRRRDAKAEVTRAEEAREAFRQKLQTDWETNVQTPGRAKFKDFDAVVVGNARAGNLQVSNELGQMIAESPKGADIMYALASDLKEAARVHAMTPLQQAAHFGRMEASIAEKPKPKKTTGAPPPVRQPSGKTSMTGKNPATKDFAEFERMANQNGK